MTCRRSSIQRRSVEGLLFIKDMQQVFDLYVGGLQIPRTSIPRRPVGVHFHERHSIHGRPVWCLLSAEDLQQVFYTWKAFYQQKFSDRHSIPYSLLQTPSIPRGSVGGILAIEDLYFSGSLLSSEDLQEVFYPWKICKKSLIQKRSVRGSIDYPWKEKSRPCIYSRPIRSLAFVEDLLEAFYPQRNRRKYPRQRRCVGGLPSMKT